LQWEKTNEISWRRNELRESKSTGGAVRLPVKKTKFPPLKPVDSVSVGMGQSSSECSMKEPNSSELWTEVVKNGTKKARPRSRCDKMVYSERGILEY
jgi:hypothetical protein